MRHKRIDRGIVEPVFTAGGLPAEPIFRVLLHQTQQAAGGQHVALGLRLGFVSRSGIQRCDRLVQPGQGQRRVQLILERLLYPARHIVAVRRRGRATQSRIHPVQGCFRLPYAILGEIERRAIVRLQQGEPERLAGEFRQQFVHGVEVAERFRHLLAFALQIAVMHPVLRKMRAGVAATALRNLVLMVRENQILPAAMDVEVGAEVFLAHGRAFDMPAGASPPPRAVPARRVVVARLPQHEIRRVPLVGCHLDPRPVDQRFPAVPRQAAIVRHRGYVEQHMAFGFIGVAGSDQALHQLDHFRNVIGRTRFHVGLQHTHRCRVGVKTIGGFLRQRTDIDAELFRPDIDLVFDVRDVAGVGDLWVEPLEQPVQDIEDHQRPRIADVNIVVDRRATDIHAHVIGIDRDEFLLFTGDGVVNS